MKTLDPSGKNSCRLGRGGTLYIKGEYVETLLKEKDALMEEEKAGRHMLAKATDRCRELETQLMLTPSLRTQRRMIAERAHAALVRELENWIGTRGWVFSDSIKRILAAHPAPAPVADADKTVALDSIREKLNRVTINIADELRALTRGDMVPAADLRALMDEWNKRSCWIVHGMRYTTHVRCETAEQAMAAHEDRHGPEAFMQDEAADINDVVKEIGKEWPDVF